MISLVEGSKPIKQKTRRIRLDMLLKVKAKLQKQWDIGFLDVVHYPQWVAIKWCHSG